MPSDSMGVSIDPTTLASGQLYGSLDPLLYPQRALGDGTVTDGTADVGALGVPVVTATAATTGGTLPAGTYAYKVVAIGPEGPGDLSAEVTATTTGTTGAVALTWTAAFGETGGYSVYGRTSGAKLHLGDVAHGASLTFTDTNAVTPAGAEPVRSKDSKAGSKSGNKAPKPVDAGATAVEGEGDSATPTEAGTGV